MIMIIGVILQTASVNYPIVLVARVITGIGSDLNVSTGAQLPWFSCSIYLVVLDLRIMQNARQPLNRMLELIIEGCLISLGIMIS